MWKIPRYRLQMVAIFGLSTKKYIRKKYPCLCFVTPPSPHPPYFEVDKIGGSWSKDKDTFLLYTFLHWVQKWQPFVAYTSGFFTNLCYSNQYALPYVILNVISSGWLLIFGCMFTRKTIFIIFDKSYLFETFSNLLIANRLPY